MAIANWVLRMYTDFLLSHFSFQLNNYFGIVIAFQIKIQTCDKDFYCLLEFSVLPFKI